MRKLLLFGVMMQLIFVSLSWAEVKKFYFPDGKLKAEVNYENGVPNGLGKIYFESGVVSTETIYVNGENNQSKRIYYTNGKLFQEVKFVNGYLAGDWKMYHPNGVLAEVRAYDDQGRQTGIVYYDEKGQIVTDGLWQGHTQDGKISGPYQIKNGKRADGLWVPEVSHEKISQGQLAPGTVRLKSGKVLEGEIIEKTGDSIKLKKGDEIKSIPLNMLDKESIDLIKRKEK
ncbi:MAG: hypothetical protein Q8Q08_09860 [Candidatus Omnitrophota bacterium]|nr:hypothetical protein [Candidatus Omnitrophota bacterium]